MNVGTQTVINTPRDLKIMTNVITEVETRLEVEICESGDPNMAKDFIKRDLLREATMFPMVLGGPWSATANY